MNDIPSPENTRPSGPALSLPGVAGQAPEPPPPSRQARRGGWLGRRGRLLLALGLVGLAAVALVRQHLVISTEHAVISAFAIPMRTPIGGEVTEMTVQPGEAFGTGTLLARVENPLADRRRLLDAAAERDRAMDEAAAAAQQLAELDAVALALVARAEELRTDTARMLAAGIEEARGLQAAAEARARRLTQDAERAMELARGGVAPIALRERAEAEREAALQEAAALAARAATLRAQQSAAERRLYLAGGYGGVSYLEQRLDEIALRRAEIARQHAALTAATARASDRVGEERTRLGTEREALLHAPGHWHAWRVLAKAGQRVQAEDVLAELVDCRDIFVLAAIPQADAPRIAPGQPARLRLAGETREIAATVLGWVPDGMAREGGRLAVLPTRPRGNSQMLRIRIAPPEPDAPCPVGRTGQVVLDRQMPVSERALSAVRLLSLPLPQLELQTSR